MLLRYSGKVIVLQSAQNLQYMHIIVTLDAQRIYIDPVKTYATTFKQALKTIDEEFNSPVRKTHIKNCLNRRRCQDIFNDQVHDYMALSRLYKVILKISRQVTPSHRGVEQSIELLLSAVIGYDWSR